jgi:hypothetical protein
MALTSKLNVVWDVTPSRLVDSAILNMETAGYSEMLTYIYKITEINI